MSKPSATFRFLDLNKMQAFTLQKEVDGAYYSASKREGRFVGSVKLCEHIFDELNIFFVRQQIDIAQCDIHIVAKLEQPNQLVAVPLVVNKLLKHIDCQLTFSVLEGD